LAEQYERFYSLQYRRLYWPGVRSGAEELAITSQREEALLAKRIERYKPFVHEGSNVLDVGSGFALLLRHWLDARVATLATAQDFDQEVLFQVAASSPGVVTCAGDLEKLAGSTFDVIHLFHVLEHVPDPISTLETVASLLAPDGILLVEVPDIGGPWRGLSMFHPAHVQHFSAATLGRTLAAAGFTILNLERWTEYPAVVSLSVVAARGFTAPAAVADDPNVRINAMHAQVGGGLRILRLKKRLLLAAGRVVPAAARAAQRRAVLRGSVGGAAKTGDALVASIGSGSLPPA
jgi:2-polyprenyl-3-methyl-5-hydroxy-6-metoxy-1,4-benzoquinol methylase